MLPSLKRTGQKFNWFGGRAIPTINFQGHLLSVSFCFFFRINLWTIVCESNNYIINRKYIGSIMLESYSGSGAFSCLTWESQPVCFSDSKWFGWNLEVPKASGNPNEPLLVGGWTNPFDRYAHQIGSFPQGSGWKEKHLKPPPSFSSFSRAKDTWKTVGNSHKPYMANQNKKKPHAQTLILSSLIHKNDHP